jgi:uncharacterized protein YwgA
MSLGELREAAVIATLIDRVNRTGRFCGETLVQKSVFFLKELFGVPVSAAFQLCYYGPFSFDLREQLQGMQADDFVKVKPHQFGATRSRWATMTSRRNALADAVVDDSQDGRHRR